MDPTGTYLTILIIGVVLTIGVGQILVRSGRSLLDDLFQRPETATSVTRLLVVLFHLIVLGVISLVAAIDITLGHPAQTIVVRLGLVLLVLGVAYGGTLMLLARLRARRRLQLLLDERIAQAEQAQVQQAVAQPYGQPHGQPYGQPHGQPSATSAPAAHLQSAPAPSYPVNDPGPGR